MGLSKSTKAQAGRLFLFCIPFCLAGLLSLGTALRTARSPEFKWINVLGLGMMGIVLEMVGLGLLLAYFLGRKKQAREDGLRASYPQSPWMWREDWARGRVESATRSTMIRAWVVTVLWNLMATPIAFLFGPRTWKADWGTFFSFLLPGAGVGLLIWALRETLRWEEFGTTWFQMSSVPGVLGKDLRGSIQVHFVRPPEHGVVLKLSCVNRFVSGTGKTRTVNEKIVWRDERNIPPEQIQSGPVGSTIPVTIPIPVDGVETNSQNPNNLILWVLEADAKVPGVNYKDIFEVPVFRTKDSPAEPPEQARAGPFSSITEVPLQQPPHSRILVKPAESGGTEFDFPAARNPGATLGTAVFFILWTGVVWLLISFKAPLLFPVIFGLFDILIFYIVLNLWLGTSTVVIGSGSVTVRRGILGLGRRREYLYSQITDITMPIGMQTGGKTGTPYYNICFTLLGKRGLTIAEGMRDKQEAEWLISQMRAAIGLKRP